MESFWRRAVVACGLGAVGSFVFFSLYKRWLELPVFSRMNSTQTFIAFICFLAFTLIALITIVIAHVKTHKPTQIPIPSSKDEWSLAANPVGRIISELGERACELLLEASKDASGTILKNATNAKLSIMTNMREFIEEGDPRSRAAWVSALERLCELDLLHEEGDDVIQEYTVKEQGYRVADKIRSARGEQKLW